MQQPVPEGTQPCSLRSPQRHLNCSLWSPISQSISFTIRTASFHTLIDVCKMNVPIGYVTCSFWHPYLLKAGGPTEGLAWRDWHSGAAYAGLHQYRLPLGHRHCRQSLPSVAVPAPAAPPRPPGVRQAQALTQQPAAVAPKNPKPLIGRKAQCSCSEGCIECIPAPRRNRA